MKIMVPETEDPTQTGCHSLQATSTLSALTNTQFRTALRERQLILARNFIF